MAKVPAAVWIVDTNKEHLAVDEARKLGIPVVAILDTNCDPDEVDYPVPGNDDAIRAVTLLTRVIADAVADGLMSRSSARTTGEEEVVAEPMPEWERELLAGGEAETPAGAATETPAAEAAATETSLAETVEAEAEATADVAETAQSVDPDTAAPETVAQSEASAE
jgi:small subunit ribosomal protein S2